MNINIYYGGRGIIDDPTIYVINKMQEVLEELRVHVERYNLYDGKTNITTLPQTLKEADGIILATTVEWYGIGGYMQQFLDACWLYGDKEPIAGIYMCPVVMSTTYGEREGKLNLATAWEILGGLPCSGICGYIENTVSLEMNEQYGHIIEKKAENMYRTINQKLASFPASNKVMRQKITIPKSINLTPQETEQLSEYVSDDSYVQRQKEDIQELTSMFRGMMDNNGADGEEEYLSEFKKAFVPQPGFEAIYTIIIEEKKAPMWIAVNGTSVECGYGETEKHDVEMSMNRAAMEDIINGRMTFQRAFMSGVMQRMKGDFRILRTLDQAFPFEERIDKQIGARKMKKEDCIFCKIANGDIPSKTLYEDEDFRVILDLGPATKGHALILPKEHADNLYELPDETASKVFVLAKKLAIKMKEKLNCDGLNIVQNNGEAAGQTVQHFHMHLIPRYVNDGQKILWTPGESTPEELEEVRRTITE